MYTVIMEQDNYMARPQCTDNNIDCKTEFGINNYNNIMSCIGETAFGFSNVKNWKQK